MLKSNPWHLRIAGKIQPSGLFLEALGQDFSQNPSVRVGFCTKGYSFPHVTCPMYLAML